MKPIKADRSKPFLSLRLKVFIFHLAFSLITGLVIFLIMISNTREQVYLMLKTDLQQFLEAGSAAVDVDMLLDLAATGEPNDAGYSDDPRYLALLDQLDQLHQAEPDAWPYLYIPGETPDEIFFVVDLISIYEPKRSAGFMEPYQSNSGYILIGLEEQAFRKVEPLTIQQMRTWAERSSWGWLSQRLERMADWLMDAGIAPVRDFGIYEDQFGRWASGYMPIRNASGENVAAIGVDIKADFIESVFFSARQNIFESLIYLVFIPLIFLFFLLLLVIWPVNKLMQVATSISVENAGTPVVFETFRSAAFRDELDQLADVLQEMLEQIRRREQRYLAVIEAQSNIILRVSPDGKFTFRNQAYENIRGKFEVSDLSEVTGAGIHPEDRQDALKFLSEIPQNISPEQRSYKHEMRLIAPSGETKWFLWTITGIFDTRGNLLEYQGVAQDISELKEIQQKLEKANKRLQEISHDLIAAGEQERNELAREVHDDVLNYMSELMINLDADISPASVAESYRGIADRLRQTVYNLRPPMLVYGLYYGLQDYAESLSTRLGDRITVEFEVIDSGAEFPNEVNTHLFRMVQQACENAVEHARASSIRISGQLFTDKAEIIVEDDGCGFSWDHEQSIDEAVSRARFGLAGIFERAAITGAEVNILSEEGKGTRVEIVRDPKNTSGTPQMVRSREAGN